MGVESYLHKYAKIVVCAWLRKKIRIGAKFKGLNNIPLDLELPKKSPMFSVYPEFPVCKSISDGKLVGIDIEWIEWLTQNNLQTLIKSKSKIPTVYELKEHKELETKLKLVSVFDIGIVDKGSLKYIFEIEHTHPSTPKKIKFIKEHKIIGYEISAQKVMEKVKLPYAIDIENSWNTKNNSSDSSDSSD